MIRSLAIILLIGAAHAGEEPWSRFRGPNGSGVAAGATMPAAIAPGVHQAWRIEVPRGYSSPVLTDDAVFITAVKGTSLYTYAVARSDGELRWQAEHPTHLEKPHRGVNSPAAPTPVTDGENVYVFFQAGGLTSYDAGGEERWSVPLGPFVTPYGVGASPILHEDLVLLLVDQDVGSFLVAVDSASGDERWRVERRQVTHGFSTPVLYTPDDGPAAGDRLRLVPGRRLLAGRRGAALVGHRHGVAGQVAAGRRRRPPLRAFVDGGNRASSA